MANVLDIIGQIATQGAGTYAQGLAQQSIKRLTIETSLGPTLVVDDPLAPSDVSSGDTLVDTMMRTIRPRITIDTTFGPTTIMPWGEPGPTRWPLVRSGLVLGGGLLALFVLWRIVR